jgi:hypothetical protein
VTAGVDLDVEVVHSQWAVPGTIGWEVEAAVVEDSMETVEDTKTKCNFLCLPINVV